MKSNFKGINQNFEIFRDKIKIYLIKYKVN